MAIEEMRWETPPPAAGGNYDWTAIAEQLRANPGQWLRVFDEGPVSIANAIRQQEVAALRPRRRGNMSGFEVRTRNNRPGPPKVCTLYLRWVDGEGDAGATSDNG